MGLDTHTHKLQNLQKAQLLLFIFLLFSVITQNIKLELNAEN